MCKRITILWIMAVCLILSGLSCDKLIPDLDETLGKTSPAVQTVQKKPSESDKSQPKPSNEHQRPKKDFSVPADLPDNYAVTFEAKNAKGKPVENAKITVIFFVEDPWGEVYPWGVCQGQYSYTFKTNSAGNCQAILPADYCYLFDAQISVKKGDYYPPAKDRVRLQNNAKLTFSGYTGEEWRALNNDCGQDSTKHKDKKFLGIF